MRMTEGIEPGSVVETHVFDEEGKIVFPLAKRMPVPPGIRIGGEFSAVGPDFTPGVMGLVENQSSARDIGDFERTRQKENPGDAGRIAPQERIIRACGSLSWSGGGLGGFEHLSPPSRKRRRLFAWERLTESAIASHWIPDAREVAARGRSTRGNVRIRRLPVRLSPNSRRKSP